jgi:hypothetical protein
MRHARRRDHPDHRADHRQPARPCPRLKVIATTPSATTTSTPARLPPSATPHPYPMPLSLGSQPKRYGQVTSTIKVPRRRAAQVTGVTLAPLLLGTRHARYHLLRPDIHTRGQPHCAAQDVPVGQNGAQPAPGPHARNPTGFLSQVLERPATHRRLTSPAPRLPGGAGAANSRRAVSTPHRPATAPMPGMNRLPASRDQAAARIQQQHLAQRAGERPGQPPVDRSAAVIIGHAGRPATRQAGR